MSPNYLTPNEIAARWRVSGLTVRNIVNRGDMEALKIGTAYRIPIEEVERYEAIYLKRKRKRTKG